MPPISFAPSALPVSCLKLLLPSHPPGQGQKHFSPVGVNPIASDSLVVVVVVVAVVVVIVVVVLVVIVLVVGSTSQLAPV